MAIHIITIHCGGTTASVDPALQLVGLGDTVQWKPDTGTATVAVAFRFPGHVHMIRSVGTMSLPAEGKIVSPPDKDEDLIYAVAAMEPSWPAPKPATAELIIAVEKTGEQSA